MVLTLVTVKKKLRQYFEAHTIVVLTNQPMRAILSKPDLSGRITKWAIELSSFDIKYQPRSATKGQLYVDGSSNQAGAGAGIILISPEGLELAKQLKISRLTVHSDSQLIVGQATEEYMTKNARMKAYRQLVKGLMNGFKYFKLKQIPREMNKRAD
ncbi:hypothetical protein ACFXTH_034425 [Malus domestica]